MNFISLKQSRTLLAAAATALLCAVLFAACGTAPLPDGIEESELETSVETTLNLLNSNNYALLTETMDDTMKASLTEASLAQAWQPKQAEMGDFLMVKESKFYGKNGYAVAVVKALYENGTVTFTLSYDDALRLGGLYFK